MKLIVTNISSSPLSVPKPVGRVLQLAETVTIDPCSPGDAENPAFIALISKQAIAITVSPSALIPNALEINALSGLS